MAQAIVPAMFLECAWSLKNRPRASVWTAPGGARTTGDPRYGVPYGRDRLIVLYLATRAAEHGRTTRGTLHDICTMFGVDWSESATLTRLRRVVHCMYEPHRGGGLDSDELTHRIAVAEEFSWCDQNKEFRIVLSENFAQDAAHGAPFSLDVARQLGQAELNLYLLLVTRLHHGQHSDLPLVGPGGAYATLPGTACQNALRQKVKLYMDAIGRAWPGCPFWMAPDGHRLIYAPRATPETRRPREPGEPSPELPKHKHQPSLG